MAMLTPKEVMSKYKCSKSTFYEWRSECLTSEYSDAVLLTSKRNTLIDEERWAEWIKHRSDIIKKQEFGI